MSEKSKYPIASLEIMRGLAATAVWFSHIYVTVRGIPKNDIVELVFGFSGFMGEAVIAFFILSGIVITLSEKHDIRRYYVARVARIAPIYLVALSMGMAIMLTNGWRFSALQVIGNVLFLQTLGEALVAPLQSNRALWSLSYEMTYYLVFPLIFFGKSRHIKIVGAGILSVVLGWIVSQREVGHGVLAHFALIFSLYPAWLLGGAVTMLARRGVAVSRPTALFVFGAGIALSRITLSANPQDVFRYFAFAAGTAILCLYLIQSRVGPPNVRYTIDVPLALRLPAVAVILTLLWAFSEASELAKIVISAVFGILAVSEVPIWMFHPGSVPRPLTAWSGRILVYLGSISYAVYAIHFPIIYAFGNVAFNGVAKLALMIPLTIALAHILERWMQPCIGNAVKRHLNASRA